MNIKRNVLLNPGPATTTDTVKLAQVVPDICPREKEFAGLMKKLRSDLLRLVHAPESEYTSVLFCGSGTINIDVCINSLLPEGKKILIVDDVISTGESLKAIENLVEKAGGVICGKMTVLAEGDAQDREDLIYLEKLPLFDSEGNVI